MSGLLLLIALVALCAGVLYLLGLRSGVLYVAVATLFLGAAGYALQGRPDLHGSPRSATASIQPVPLTPLRRAFYGEFTPHEHWMIIADSYTRRGETADAVGVLKKAAGTYPDDPSLWVALGNALVDHAGVLTAPAELAYRRGAELSPGYPAPPFFLGLAAARSGDRQSALTLWRDLLANAPADASWRPMVEDAIAALSGPAPAQPR
jgi:cytochrome c-type biogenesis protein CcmH